jgi:RecB family endonuclease NucS
MVTEKDMENAIISDPERYVGEEGLKLIAQQFRIGKYIFDLLFEDRHNGKLIVELQKGTLDREHTYKILDYYDEYKDSHPEEFIDLMVIANTIPPERKKRLSSFGVTFKEIPASDFIKDLVTFKR